MGLITRWLAAWRDRPDPAAVMQTPVIRFAGYDPSKQASARLRALERDRAARKVADGYAAPAGRVVRIDERRAK